MAIPLLCIAVSDKGLFRHQFLCFPLLREALLTFVHGFELEFLLLLLLRIIIDFCEGTMDPRHSVLSTGSLKS